MAVALSVSPQVQCAFRAAFVCNNAESSNVSSGLRNSGTRPRGWLHRSRGHRELVQQSWCSCGATNFASDGDGGVEVWGLGFSKLDAVPEWERDARICSKRGRCTDSRRCWPDVENGRWRRRRVAATRCGNIGSGGDGARRSSVAVLDGYLMRELLSPLILGTAAFTVLGVSIGVGPELVALIEKLGFSSRRCLLYVRLVFLRLPTYVSLALPMASLLASMLAFGRLGVDSEVTALRAAGIRSIRMLQPTFVLFLGVTALHLLLAEGLTPRANQIAMDATNAAVASVSTIWDSDKPKTSSAAFIRPVIYPEYRQHRLAHLLYSQGFDGFNSLLTVTFVQLERFQDQVTTTETPQPKLNAETVPSTALSVRRVVLSEEATWDELQGLWIFSNGCEYALGKGNPQSNGSSLQGVRRFSSQYVSELTRAPLDFAKLGVNKSFEDMTLFEASSLLDLMKASRNVKESRKLQVKIQQRLSLPFASIVFGTVGCLLSLHLPREQTRVGLALTLVTVFGYYSVSVFGSLIGQLGYVSPVLGAWLPNLAGALLALALLFSTP